MFNWLWRQVLYWLARALLGLLYRIASGMLALSVNQVSRSLKKINRERDRAERWSNHVAFFSSWLSRMGGYEVGNEG